MTWLIGVYRAWPLRPHCDGDEHTALCRWLGTAGSRCPAKNA